MTGNIILFRLSRGEKHFQGEEMGKFLLEKIYLRKFEVEDGLKNWDYSLKVSTSFIIFANTNDKKCRKTMDSFIQAGDFLVNLKFSDEELESYKIQMLKNKVNLNDYLENQLTMKKDEQDRRKQIISTTLADIQKNDSGWNFLHRSGSRLSQGC